MTRRPQILGAVDLNVNDQRDRDEKLSEPIALSFEREDELEWCRRTKEDQVGH